MARVWPTRVNGVIGQHASGQSAIEGLELVGCPGCRHRRTRDSLATRGHTGGLPGCDEASARATLARDRIVVDGAEPSRFESGG
jgi:hypothetical protein